jgi:succinate-acetate transporter protein
MVSNKKTQVAFLFAQASGGLGNFLQSFAIFLAPVAFLATINSLRGIQYVFLFMMTLFITLLFPKILKEKISRRIVFQKIISIIIIGVGLAILVIY